ncbi:TatD family hydrolase, partial [Candidatus Gracilibacteria bacterium]|nr:TatD family hydrolase [Candidatus Gracilibacteria bacterium]
MLIDTHAHIMFPEFDEDREEVIQRAMDAGLERIVCVGCGAGSSETAVKMAQEDKSGFLYATVGLHPYDAMDVTDGLLAEWEKWILADRRKIIAIGETGLDYFKSKVDPEKQKISFKKHLELAVKMGLPVIVHNRSADEDCLNLLMEFSRGGELYKKLVQECGCDG